jgi:hypothetical protein
MIQGAVFADADTGYGGLLNVHHTVRGYGFEEVWEFERRWARPGNEANS